jgi:hypothetical protein
MVDGLLEMLNVLNSLQPLGVIGLLAVVIFLLVKNRSEVAEIGDNHLHDLPAVVASLGRMEGLLQSINNNIIYLKAKAGDDE